MKKILSFSLAALLIQTFFAQQTFAETEEEKFAARVRAEISKLGTGVNARIKVKLKDGTKIKGYVTEAGENRFTVMNSKTGQAVPVGYAEVSGAKGGNLSKGTIVTIGLVGIAVLVLVLLGTAT